MMNSTAHFDARAVRDALLRRRDPNEAGFISYAHRPYDNRWLYWEADGGLLDRPRPDYRRHVFEGNMWVEARHREPREFFSRGTLARNITGDFGNGRSHFFPAWLHDEGLGLGTDGAQHRPNLSDAAQRYLNRLDLGVDDLFHHTLAVLHDPAYREANAGALRMEWPRIPLPGWPDGSAQGAAEQLTASAERGRELARLLDPETPVSGVTTGTLLPELASIAVAATADGGNMADGDFKVTAG